jgi:hypothetical protein
VDLNLQSGFQGVTGSRLAPFGIATAGVQSEPVWPMNVLCRF